MYILGLQDRIGCDVEDGTVSPEPEHCDGSLFAPQARFHQIPVTAQNPKQSKHCTLLKVYSTNKKDTTKKKPRYIYKKSEFCAARGARSTATGIARPKDAGQTPITS